MIYCPNCGIKGKSKVLETRRRENSISRRRECLKCKERFSSTECPTSENDASYKVKLSYLQAELVKLNEAFQKVLKESK
jgi:transcriptional regulator NrdR family protein